MLTKRFLKTSSILFCSLLAFSTAPLKAASDTFIDYQNYNHGYCPTCNCFPCKCSASAVDEDGDGMPGPASAPPCAQNSCAQQAPCQQPNPCQPATICATDCGINLCWIGLGIALVATAAALIVSSNNGSLPDR